MLAAFMLGLAPLVLVAIAVSSVRHALPLMLAGLASWAKFNATGQVWDALWAGLSVLILGATTLHILSQSARTRSLTIVLEWLAGLALAMLFTFAVCYSGGLRGGALILALSLSALIASYATLSFRAPDEHAR
jgi:hypothetical protein